MKFKISIVIVFLSSIITLGFKADETPLEKLLKQLAKITASYPQEKVHLHLDKPYYAVGEDIWLKAYIVTAEKNEPSLLSKVLYVDLINEKNELKKKITLPVSNGVTNGNITLIGDSLTSGNYRIRAYTNYMRNYKPDFFFEKQVIIGNVLDSVTQKIKEKKLELSLQFFPEGGHLVNGLRSNVGVKAITSDGYGINLSGYIENKKGEKVTNFTSEHAGMGAFTFIPNLADSYVAIVKLTDGTTKSFQLPKTEESGYTLSINPTNENINLRISASENLIDGKEVYVIAQANGKTYASLTSKMDRPNLVANLPKNKFSTGIVHFTLFNSNFMPVAERLIFINHKDDLKITINKPIVGHVKKKADIGFSVSDLNETPVDGNFSIAIIDESKVKIDEDNETSILSNLLLTSDLKGFIEKPNYYFNPANADREKHLDNLLLTQGWSRFVWEGIKTSKEPTITFKPEQSLEITGRITSWGNKPLSNAKISFFASRAGFSLNLDTSSNQKGDFNFDSLDLPDSTVVIVKAKSGKAGSNVNISLNQRPKVNDSPFLGNSINILPYLQSTKEMYVELNNYNQLNKGILLKTVTITGLKVLKSVLNIKNSTNASGSANYVINMKMLKGAINIYSPLHKAPGVMVNRGMVYSTRHMPSSMSTNSGGGAPMLLIVDGVRINQNAMPDYLQSINPADVAGIEILTSNYFLSVLGDDALSGVIYITTKRGNEVEPTLATNIAKISNAGYTTKKEFYSPDYDDPKTNEKMLDLRSTIYWNPNINTDLNGQATVNFFNASTPGNYRITIEGIDDLGNIGRKVFNYEVKPSIEN